MMKKLLAAFSLAVGVLATSPASAYDLRIKSTDTKISDVALRDAVLSVLPEHVKALGPDYQVVGILETTKYMDIGVIYYYSVMLHKKIIDRDSGKVYWAATGGIRGNGVSEGGNTLLEGIKSTVVTGAKSFRPE